MAENPFYAKAFPYQFTPHFYPERIRELCKIPAGSKVFVCSMGELFGENHEWTEEVLLAIENHPELTFQVLTKQPQNLEQFSPFPNNCWVGVSATDFHLSARALYRGLDGIKADVKFLSFEPLLGDVNILAADFKNTGANWAIIGQQTPAKKSTEPKPFWIGEIVNACNKSKTPVFLKNNLIPMIDELPDNCFTKTLSGDMNLRQEMPVVSP